MLEYNQSLRNAVKLLTDAGADCAEAEQYVSEMTKAVPDYKEKIKE